MVQSVQTRIIAADYFEFPEYKNHDLIQLVDGEVVIDMPPIPKHQRIVRQILLLLVRIATPKGGEVLMAPIELYLDEYNIYEPDVLYIAPDSRCRVEEKRLVGAPDLVVEVLSPGTAKHDRQQKYRAYEQHGVGEYWIVDPAHEVIEVWVHENGRFDRVGAYGADDTFESRILGETVPVKDMFTE
jgi:Uma2 family endonuclease